MSDLTPMAERHTRALTELMELGLALARKHQDRAMAAETAEEERVASLAFHRISRSVRQTLALEAQLERLHRRLLAEEIEATELRTSQAVKRRRALVKAVVSRLVWAEREADDVDGLIEHLDTLLGEDALGDDFLSQPMADYIQSLRGDLGLKPDEASITPVIPRSGDTPDPGDPSGPASSSSQPPASTSGRAEDDAGCAEPAPWAGTWPNSS